MRFKLFNRRRMTIIGTPRLAVRHAMPWPLRWVLGALVLGFCGAISLWAFETGKGLAGLDRDAKKELENLRTEVVRLRSDLDKAQSIANTAESTIATEKSASQALLTQIKQLEGDNHALRDDLGFFEKLIPASTTETLSIRGLQGEVKGDRLKWQTLVIQPVKNAPEFSGKLLLSVSGTLAGKPWVMDVPNGTQELRFKQYRRVEGLITLPAQAVVKDLTVKVADGSATRATQSVKF